VGRANPRLVLAFPRVEEKSHQELTHYRLPTSAAQRNLRHVSNMLMRTCVLCFVRKGSC
jgi:hypothetical protein